MIYRPWGGHEYAIFNKLTDDSDAKSFLEFNSRNSVMIDSHIYIFILAFPHCYYNCYHCTYKSCFDYHSKPYNVIQKCINTFSVNEWNNVTVYQVVTKGDLPILSLLLVLLLCLNPEWKYAT